MRTERGCSMDWTREVSSAGHVMSLHGPLVAG